MRRSGVHPLISPRFVQPVPPDPTPPADHCEGRSGRRELVGSRRATEQAPGSSSAAEAVGRTRATPARSRGGPCRRCASQAERRLAPEGAASVGQVERLIRADIEAGRIHRLAVGQRPLQIDVAMAVLPQFNRRLQYPEPGPWTIPATSLGSGVRNRGPLKSKFPQKKFKSRPRTPGRLAPNCSMRHEVKFTCHNGDGGASLRPKRDTPSAAC
jgi:hypothetical protein